MERVLVYSELLHRTDRPRPRDGIVKLLVSGFVNDWDVLTGCRERE